MKKLLLIAVLSLGLVSAANAQEIGKLWLGGTAGVGYTKHKISGHETTGFNFQVLPEIGYVMNEDVSMGIAVGYGQYKFDKSRNVATDVKTFQVKPFVRYTFVRLDRVSFFTEGTVGYEWSKFGKGVSEMNTYEFGLRPGFALHLSDKVNFITKVGFAGYTHSKQGDIKTNDFGLNVDMENILFGVNVFF